MLRRRSVVLAALLVVIAAVLTLATAIPLRSQRSAIAGIEPESSKGAAARRPTSPVPFGEARAIMAGLGEAAPPILRNLQGSQGEDQWRQWLFDHDRSVRARIDRGNEDSLYYFWLYGTTFTGQPRATREEVSSRTDRATVELLESRLNDLVTGIVNPRGNDRLAFARRVVEHRDINLSSPEGRELTRAFLVQIRNRVVAENDRYARIAAAGSLLTNSAQRDTTFGTMLRDRGLSTDTSLEANFSVMGALLAARAKGVVVPGTLGRIGIIGPGLDFTDKAEGYDFYPEQSLQPYAVVDAVRQLALQSPDGLAIVTLDINPRINRHLDRARTRAAGGTPYVLHVLFDRPAYRDVRREFVRYWQTIGSAIGSPVAPASAALPIPSVDVRAVAVRPDVVRVVLPLDRDVVTERLDLRHEGDRFDLIIATNVLVYYDRLEQALALSNISAMLKAGGLFLTNSGVTSPRGLRPLGDISGPVSLDRGQADEMLWYRREP